MTKKRILIATLAAFILGISATVVYERYHITPQFKQAARMAMADQTSDEDRVIYEGEARYMATTAKDKQIMRLIDDFNDAYNVVKADGDYELTASDYNAAHQQFLRDAMKGHAINDAIRKQIGLPLD